MMRLRSRPIDLRTRSVLVQEQKDMDVPAPMKDRVTLPPLFVLFRPSMEWRCPRHWGPHFFIIQATKSNANLFLKHLQR